MSPNSLAGSFAVLSMFVKMYQCKRFDEHAYGRGALPSVWLLVVNPLCDYSTIIAALGSG
jgi:hypothetical protein